MTFDELKNGMKSLFSSLGAKTSDSNYAVGLFDKTSAEPKGIMDMASLASVLGGINTNVNSGNDANSLVSPGNYFWGSYLFTPQNMPLQMAGWMRVDVFNLMIAQRVFYNFGGGSTKSSVYERIKWGDDWGDWARLDNFGCNTLAELKAALANV